MIAEELERFADIPDPLAAVQSAAANEGLSRVRERVAAVPSPSRPKVVRRRLLAAGAALGWSVALGALLGVRADLSELPTAYVLLWCLSPFALAALGVTMLARAGRSGLGVNMTVAAVLALGMPLLVALLALGLPAPVSHGPTPGFLQGLAMCLDLTLVGAAPSLVVAVLALKNAFPAAARWRGALVGAAAGLLSATAMNLHCPLVDPMHMLLGHALPISICTAIGALLAHRFMRS